DILVGHCLTFSFVPTRMSALPKNVRCAPHFSADTSGVAVALFLLVDSKTNHSPARAGTDTFRAPGLSMKQQRSE
ncbi:MAG: hypothetical protein NTW03_14925, partial [Verrucomicrobia bacterium]|nr:hypothetical protein [Verrucomicrobiota bacterium]